MGKKKKKEEIKLIPPIENFEKITQKIAEKLGETNPTNIRWMVYKRGPVIAVETMKAALEFYKTKPLTKDGSKLRSAGGCFILIYPEVKKRFQKEGKYLKSWPVGKPANLIKPSSTGDTSN